MMARFECYLDSLSPHKIKTNKNVRIGPPVAKLSGSAHEISACMIVYLALQIAILSYSINVFSIYIQGTAYM